MGKVEAMNNNIDRIHQISDILQQSANWGSIYEEQINAANLMAKMVKPTALSGTVTAAEKLVASFPTVDLKPMETALNRLAVEMSSAVDTDLITRQVLNLVSMPEFTYDYEVLVSVLSNQLAAIYEAQQIVRTPGIVSLLESFRKASWIQGMNQFVEDISVGYTEAANIVLLKKVDGLSELVEGGYPSWVKQLLRKMHKRTGESLAQNDQIEVNVRDKKFRPVSQSNITVGVESINVIASSTELFTEITEQELMIFMDTLSNCVEFAGSTPTGKKIFEIICSWNNFIDFDQLYYYHSRAKKRNGCPYTSDEMGKAPNTFVGYGRYNHMNESHYYFSDNQKGAEMEVKKHKQDADVQTVRLRPRRSIKMIDLSEEIVRPNLFLRSLRYEYVSSQDNMRPKEYLLPEYVATCCKRAGIEGIKYYGSKEYKNYVSWSGEYFDVDLSW